jgi:uncharacterized repeat protein (TIGR03803 family)
MTNSAPRRGLSFRAASAALALLVVLGIGVAATPSAQAQTFTVLYNFTGLPDGASPQAGLVRDAAGNLYGTTANGGLPGLCYQGDYGCGTVFKVDATGTETVLHRFGGGGGADGAYPQAGLIRDGSGNLYGTTSSGGNPKCIPWGCGTVFKVDKRGTETVLYRFTGRLGDGCYPFGGLIRDKAGNLYGTTWECGYSGYGTVFKLDTTGTETVLHSFAGYPLDGSQPYLTSLLMDKQGNLYGVTNVGGVEGPGAVFKLSPKGELTILHSFANGTDGSYPSGRLIRDKEGNLYGTTEAGGGDGNCPTIGGGCGTVYEVSEAGKETILHRFDGTDGAFPFAGLIADTKGNLYGDTYDYEVGYGTVFKLSKSGTLTVLHSFSGSDGTFPIADLIRDANGNLYGTASVGGNTNCDLTSGCGTVWKLTP